MYIGFGLDLQVNIELDPIITVLNIRQVRETIEKKGTSNFVG